MIEKSAEWRSLAMLVLKDFFNVKELMQRYYIM
jgi:hypothetical protein